MQARAAAVSVRASGRSSAAHAGLVRATIGVTLAFLCHGCGARDDLRRAEDAGVGRTGGRRAAGGRAPIQLRDASFEDRFTNGSGGRAAGGADFRDATVDVGVDASDVRDATTLVDAPQGEADAEPWPDCRCPETGYAIQARVDGSALVFDEPYRLYVYCEETAVQLAHPWCGEAYRLSGCVGPGDSPPCIYVVVDRASGDHHGHWVDGTGQTWELASGDILPQVLTRRLGVGSFYAVFTLAGRPERVEVNGDFRACVPLLPECPR